MEIFFHLLLKIFSFNIKDIQTVILGSEEYTRKKRAYKNTALGKLSKDAHSFQGDEGKREDNKNLFFFFFPIGMSSNI